MTSIDHANLSRLDLNLLVAFDALLTERSVTRAAARVGLGQSAMSHNLARLRILFGDELLTRGADGMRPTPRALELADPVRVTLSQIQAAVLQREAFDPSTADRAFRIGLADSIEVALIPGLMARLRGAAPDVALRLRSTNRLSILEELDSGRLDLGIGVFDHGQIHHKRRPLYTDNFLCLFSPKQLNLAPPISLADYLRLPHMLTSLSDDAHGAVDDVLQAEVEAHHRADHAGISCRAIRVATSADHHHDALAARALFCRGLWACHQPRAYRAPNLHHLAPLACELRSGPGSCLAQTNRGGTSIGRRIGVVECKGRVVKNRRSTLSGSRPLYWLHDRRVTDLA